MILFNLSAFIALLLFIVYVNDVAEEEKYNSNLKLAILSITGCFAFVFLMVFIGK